MRFSIIFVPFIFAALSSASVHPRGQGYEKEPCCYEYTSYFVTTGTTVITTLGVDSTCVEVTIPTCFEEKW